MKTTLKPSEIKPNPDNPRIIRDDQFKKLVQSLKDFPEMADVREVVVNTDHVILGGNMRFRAMVDAGWKQIPVKIVDWPIEKQREFVIKDNVSGGEWDYDMLANQYELVDLDAWGLTVPKMTELDDADDDDMELESKKVVEVTLQTDDELQALYNELSERGYTCRVLTL